MNRSDAREARAEGQRRRIVQLLEAMVAAAGGDVADVEQCATCGGYYKSVSSHKQHCDGPQG